MHFSYGWGWHLVGILSLEFFSLFTWAECVVALRGRLGRAWGWGDGEVYVGFNLCVCLFVLVFFGVLGEIICYLASYPLGKQNMVVFEYLTCF